MSAVEILEPEVEQRPAHEDRALRGASQGLGKSSRKRQKDVFDTWRRLQNETRLDRSSGRVIGPNQPCTIVNFNPIDLVIDIEGRRFTVPAAGRFKTNQLKCNYAGRDVQGSWIKFENPIVYASTTGHESSTAGWEPADVPTHTVKHYTPHAIGCALYEQYNSPNYKMMGGLLFFDQDIRQLLPENLERNQGMLLVPERTLVGSEYSFRMREALFEEELERLFERQRNYCDMQIQSAHALATEEDENARKMVTDTHREWARYAVKMYWMRELPEWVTSRITAAGPIKQLVRCRYCGTGQTNPDNYFCAKCNAPYDAYKAFKAGLVVPQMYLEALQGEELEEVVQELRERKSRFSSLLNDVPSPSEDAVPAKQLHGAAKVAAEAKRARDAAAQQQSQTEGTDE